MKVVGYMRVNSIEQLGGTQVAEKEKSMVEKILDTERAGYAYFYPSDGGNRQEFLFPPHRRIWRISLAVIFMMQRR